MAKDILSLENNTEEGIGIEDDLEFIQEDYIDSLASENEGENCIRNFFLIQMMSFG